MEFVSVEAANECKSLFDRFKRRQLVQDEDEQTSNRIHKVLADRDFESIEKMSASELDYLARHVCLWVISK